MSRRLILLATLSLVVVTSCGSAESGSGDLSFMKPGEFVSVSPPTDQEVGEFDDPYMFPENQEQGPMQLWSVGPDGSGLRRLTETAGVDSYDPRLSPDGSLISYFAYDFESEGPTRPEIWVMSVDGSNARELPLGELLLEGSSTSWDSTGSKIYFTARDKTESGVWSIDVSSGDLSRTSVEAKDLSLVNWSPDGSRVAFMDVVESADGDWLYWDLWIADADGSNPKRVTDSDFDSISSPEWLPDGSAIVFQAFPPGWSPRGTSNLWRVDLEDGRITRVPGSEAINDVWKVSPDGKFVAYQSYNGMCQALVVAVDGSGEMCALSNSNMMNFAWSPDSTRLVFVLDGYSPDPATDSNGEMMFPEPGLALWTMAIDGSDPRQLTQPFPQSMGYWFSGTGYSGLEWRDTPEGELILFTMYD